MGGWLGGWPGGQVAGFSENTAISSSIKVGDEVEIELGKKRKKNNDRNSGF